MFHLLLVKALFDDGGESMRSNIVSLFCGENIDSRVFLLAYYGAGRSTAMVDVIAVACTLS